MEEEEESRVCENCGRWVAEDEVLFNCRIEIYAEARLRDLEKESDPGEAEQEWEDLIRHLEEMSDEEVQEATDEVHESYEFSLCPECRREMHRRIRSRKDLLA